MANVRWGFHLQQIFAEQSASSDTLGLENFAPVPIETFHLERVNDSTIKERVEDVATSPNPAETIQVWLFSLFITCSFCHLYESVWFFGCVTPIVFLLNRP